MGAASATQPLPPPAGAAAESDAPQQQQPEASAGRAEVRRAGNEALLATAARIAGLSYGGVIGRTALRSSGTPSPLMDAIAIVAEAEGVQLADDCEIDPSTPLADAVERIAYASRFQAREVKLGGGWWRRSGPALVGRLRDAGDAGEWRAVALVAGASSYCVADGTSAKPARIDASLAARIDTTAYMLYPALPDRVSASSLRTFLARGLGGETKRLVAAALLVALAGLISPLATAAIVGSAVPDGQIGLAGEMALLLICAAVGGAGFQLMRSLALLRMTSRLNLRVQAAAWHRILDLPAGFFRSYATGDLSQRVVGIDFAFRALSGSTITGLLGSVFSLAGLILMFAFDTALAVYGLLFGLLAAAVMFAIGYRRVALERSVFMLKGETMSRLLEMLGAVAKLRVAAAEERALARWSRPFGEQMREQARAGRISNLQDVAGDVLAPLGTLGAFLVVVSASRAIDVAAFSAFNMAFAQFTAGLIAFAQSVNTALIAVPLLERARPIVQAEPEVARNRLAPGRLTGHIALRNVSFRYRADGPWTIDDVSLDIHPGEFVAIVGASGSGKSTLIRLLLGFEQPGAGAVLYDGNNLDSLDLRQVRRQIGSVLQTVQLVPGSIYENIAGSGRYTREDVMDAARAAGLAEHIEALPMKLETMICEGAAMFSGGQRQLMLIARALVRKSKIVFFDEATSALDNKTQAIVSASLDDMKATRVVIAHRLSTIRSADRIIVLARGQIVEEGRYDELIARKGAFFELARRQIL